MIMTTSAVTLSAMKKMILEVLAARWASHDRWRFPKMMEFSLIGLEQLGYITILTRDSADGYTVSITAAGRHQVANIDHQDPNCRCQIGARAKSEVNQPSSGHSRWEPRARCPDTTCGHPEQNHTEYGCALCGCINPPEFIRRRGRAQLGAESILRDLLDLYDGPDVPSPWDDCVYNYKGWCTAHHWEVPGTECPVGRALRYIGEDRPRGT